MKLIPEEIRYLREQMRRLKESQDTYYEYMRSREIKTANGPELHVIGDTLTEEKFQREFANYRCIMDTLINSEYITNPSTEEIEVGTKFVIMYDSSEDEDEEILVLTEGGFGYGVNDSIVTIDSPLGKVIQGKKAGEPFEFTLQNDIRINLSKRKISGQVKEIKTDRKLYVQFIRDKDYRSRISKTAKKTIHSLLNSASEDDNEEFKKLQEITPSQKELLEIKIKRLSKAEKTSSNISQLAYLKKLYRTANIAEPTYDGTIGVGTTFELMVSDGENVTTSEYEMINKAVSDEMENEYIERISIIGGKIFGLKQDDQFEFVKNNKKYKGIITRVDIPEKTTAITYQKKN